MMRTGRREPGDDCSLRTRQCAGLILLASHFAEQAGGRFYFLCPWGSPWPFEPPLPLQRSTWRSHRAVRGWRSSRVGGNSLRRYPWLIGRMLVSAETSAPRSGSVGFTDSNHQTVLGHGGSKSCGESSALSHVVIVLNQTLFMLDRGNWRRGGRDAIISFLRWARLCRQRE